MTREEFASLLVAGGLDARPTNSPGWAMLKAVKSGVLRGPGGELCEVKAGTTRVHYRHWTVTRYPEFFRVVDKRDVRTAREHSRALSHVRSQLERGRPGARAPSSSGSFRLPRHTAPAFKLP